PRIAQSLSAAAPPLLAGASRPSWTSSLQFLSERGGPLGHFRAGHRSSGEATVPPIPCGAHKAAADRSGTTRPTAGRNSAQRSQGTPPASRRVVTESARKCTCQPARDLL